MHRSAAARAGENKCEHRGANHEKRDHGRGYGQPRPGAAVAWSGRRAGRRRRLRQARRRAGRRYGRLGGARRATLFAEARRLTGEGAAAWTGGSGVHRCFDPSPELGGTAVPPVSPGWAPALGGVPLGGRLEGEDGAVEAGGETCGAGDSDSRAGTPFALLTRWRMRWSRRSARCWITLVASGFTRGTVEVALEPVKGGLGWVSLEGSLGAGSRRTGGCFLSCSTSELPIAGTVKPAAAPQSARPASARHPSCERLRTTRARAPPAVGFRRPDW
jgi:hypothetical protein